MRDLVLREGLRTMAGDASLLLRDLLASGAEIPYEVREAGSGSPIAEYVPQTSRFVREHSHELSRLDSFGTTCAAIESEGLAESYLHEMGVPVPADTRRRAELAGVVFCCRMWQGSTDFTLDDMRLGLVIEELVDLGEVSLGEVEIAVPLRGFQMDVERLELAGATIVRANTVDVPSEARGGDGMGGAAWEPTFLLVTRIDSVGASEDDADLGVRAVVAFKHTITSLRLFKSGGVALGPHAWVKAGGDRWRRISTGAGRPRPGGYRLADTELGDVAALSRGLAAESTPFHRIGMVAGGFIATLGRSLSRFEAGLERSVTLDALNDYLLSLRFLLEGGGPASLGLSMRVSALCAEPERRAGVKSTVDRAVSLERELWSGEPAGTAKSPAEVASGVEDLTRAILRDASLGHLGNDLRITADEILLGEGLRVGEGASPDARGETAEWTPAPDEDDAFTETELETELEEAMRGRREPETVVEAEVADESPPEPEEQPVIEAQADDVHAASSPRFNRAQNLIHDLAPEAEFEWSEPAPSSEREPDRGPVTQLAFAGGHDDDADEPAAPGRILRAVPDSGPVADLIADSDNHRRQVASRVSFLFPAPETTEWSVREVGYDRTRKAEVDLGDPAGRAS